MAACKGKPNVVSNKQQVCSLETSVAITTDTISMLSDKEILKHLQGDWQCDGYAKDTSSIPKEEQYEDSYAKEFSSHVCLSIVNDTLKVEDIYVIPIKLERKDDSLSIVPVQSYEEYAWKNKLPSYSSDPPIMNRISVVGTHRLVITDRGFYFSFSKMKRVAKSSIHGIPGDDRNYFRVEFKDKSTDINKVLKRFCVEFPYGAELLLYKNQQAIQRNDWSIHEQLTFERTQAIGKFVLELSCHSGHFNIAYYATDDADNEYD
jgi:hypothetical protein